MADPVYHQVFRTRDEARRAVCEYIEMFYNRIRRHSTLGYLSPAEFEMMKMHTVIGADILSGSAVPLLEVGREIAESHHEWWNGSGYPHRLEGEGEVRMWGTPWHGEAMFASFAYCFRMSQKPWRVSRCP